MDKGKQPMQEEEDLLSLLMDYNPNNSLALTPSVLNSAISEEATNPRQNWLTGFENRVANDPTIFSSMIQGSGSGSGPSFTKGDEFREEFMTQFLTINGTVSSSRKQSSDATTSNEVPTQVPVETNVVPPESRPATVGRSRHSRKPMPPEVLANLAKEDPKRAKRILTNRMSAVRAKEKKRLYTYMLEHQLQSLQSESTVLSTRLRLMQREGRCLSADNAKLKHQTQMVRQQVDLQESLNDEIRKEIQHLKMIKQIAPNCGIMFNPINVCSGYNDRASDTPLGTEQFPQPLVQNPSQGKQGFNNHAGGAPLGTEQFPHLNVQNPYQGQQGYNNHAGAPLGTEQFLHPPVQNPYQGQQVYNNNASGAPPFQRQQLQPGIEQLNLGQDPYQVQYEQGLVSQLQNMEQQDSQQHHHQLQDFEVQLRLPRRDQYQPLSVDKLDADVRYAEALNFANSLP